MRNKETHNMKLRFTNILLTIALLLSTTMFGQDTLPDSNNNQYPESESPNNNAFPEPIETTEVLSLPLSRLDFQLSLCILGFGILLILLEIYLVRNKNISSEDTIKFVIITIIIVSTLFLITAGYSNDQIAPAVGLLGTIAGYLLGRINSSNKKENEKD